MSTDSYIIIQRLDWIKEQFIRGQRLNCTDIAHHFKVDAKTANRYLDLLRKHNKIPLIYDASARRFYLPYSHEHATCPHDTVRCLCCGAEGAPASFVQDL